MGTVVNQQLFSHTFLARLQADPSRDQAAAAVAQGLRDWLSFRDSSSLQALVDSWVGPVLDFLGFHHTADKDDSHKSHLFAGRGDETPVGLCWAVPPGQNLDDTTKGRDSQAQAVLALRSHHLRWGVLTDGSRWRLLDADALQCYEHYLEVDLDELARSSDPTPLRIFYACFHRGAFAPDASGACGLDRLLEDSTAATEAAEKHLRTQVSHNEGIMAQLCLGLVQADGRTGYSEEERDAIYRDATYLLYRLLFLFHAEARGLLPMEHPAYRAVSLTELVKTAHEYKLHGMPNPQGTTLWDRLRRLSSAIYENDPDLGIPAYNGGLFDDDDKPHLHTGYIADMYLTEALFDLAYIPDRAAPEGYRPIDYRDLSVRHLGNLYEGMIEYKLQIAEETLWARRDGKGNLCFLRAGEEGAPRKTDEEFRPGSVYFSQSPGERHATGTYYTPEHIVHYIVHQTVWQGLAERRAPLEVKVANWLEEISGTADPDEQARMQRVADEELLRFVEEQVLAFRVCDPAMGSGHFLANAAHQITAFIVETLHLTPWRNSAIDASPLTWRRRVVERCLYGVDISLMAVELAKLSLWLASVAVGKPLSFLDHRLRQGNSLIGARLDDLTAVLGDGTTQAATSRQEQKAKATGQLWMFDDPAFSRHVVAATDLLAEISHVAETAGDVKAQEADYGQVRAEMEPYRQVANLVVARHFGVPISTAGLQSLVKRQDHTSDPAPDVRDHVARAQRLADTWHFFSWELEFPDVFLSRRGAHRDELKFDAVLGNPPYDVLVGSGHRKNLELELSYYRSCGHYHYAFGGRVNIYRLMLERALSLTRQGCLLGFVVPDTLFGDKGARSLREYLWQKTEMQLVEVFPKDDLECRVFPDAEQPVCIPVLRKGGVSSEVRLRIHPCRYVEPASPIVRLGLEDIRLIDPETLSVPIVTPEAAKLLLKLHLSEKNARIGGESGIAAGYEGEVNVSFHARFITSEGTDAMLVRGEHVHRYEVLLEETRTDKRRLDKDGFFASSGDAEKASHHRIERVAVQGVKGKNRQRRITACLIPAGVFLANSADYYLVKPPYNPRYLLAHLNSRVPEWRFRLTSTNNNINVYEIEAIPIRRIDFVTPPTQRERLAGEGQQLFSRYSRDGDQAAILAFVGDQLDQIPERADVVHDLVSHLAQEMIDLYRTQRQIEREAIPRRDLLRGVPCRRLDQALSIPAIAGENVPALSTAHHDIAGLRLTPQADGRWLLEVELRLRDPGSGWHSFVLDEDGNPACEWQPVGCLPLNDAAGFFYQYAFAHLDSFAHAGKILTGTSGTALGKLGAMMVPEFAVVDLAPLIALESKFADVHHKIHLTDALIDQIIYRLYGLTEDEIAIVEGRK